MAKRLRFLVTAGPTREPLDAIRFLTNRSSGKMGYALATAARDRCHVVRLVSGPVSIPPVAGVALQPVETAEEMCAAVLGALPHSDVLVMCAAVADYRPAEVLAGKREKREGDEWLLRLVRTPDILLAVGRAEFDGLRVGFAAEYGDPVPRATEKLERKALDLIVANDISRPGLGMGADDGHVCAIDRWGGRRWLGPDRKSRIAAGLLDVMESAWLRREEECRCGGGRP